MAAFWQKLKNLFTSSNKISITDFHYLKKKLIYWNENRSYPESYELPQAIRFSSHFWKRIKEIHRHTSGDEHERAISLWWGDGDIVVTDSLRGGRSRVNIPKQSVIVKYKPVSQTSSYAQKIIEVNGKVYLKKSVPVSILKSKKKIEVQYLFNMHTHPPHRTDSGNTTYSFFSDTDIRSFLASNACFTGLVTDKLWLLAKTKSTPASLTESDNFRITLDYLCDQQHMKVYKGLFSKALVAQCGRRVASTN